MSTAKRYCEMCDDWTSKKECPACGMPTRKALPEGKRMRRTLLLEIERADGYTSMDVTAVGVQRIYQDGKDTGARMLVYQDIEGRLCCLDADACFTIAVSEGRR